MSGMPVNGTTKMHVHLALAQYLLCTNMHKLVTIKMADKKIRVKNTLASKLLPLTMSSLKVNFQTKQHTQTQRSHGKNIFLGKKCSWARPHPRLWNGTLKTGEFHHRGKRLTKPCVNSKTNYCTRSRQFPSTVNMLQKGIQQTPSIRCQAITMQSMNQEAKHGITGMHLLQAQIETNIDITKAKMAHARALTSDMPCSPNCSPCSPRQICTP